MQIAPLYARTSHHYAPGWSHLDDYEFLGTFRHTEPRLAHVSEDGDLVHVLHAKFTPVLMAEARRAWRRHAPRARSWAGRERKGEPFRLPFKLWLAGAIADGFTHGCRCEHDCCGHYQTSARVTIEGRHVRIRTHSYQNV